MPPKKRSNKQSKATAASPAAPLRMTRSRAASQGLELPTKFTTPPDKVRRSRKTSKSSQGSIPVIAETVELDAPAQEPIVVNSSSSEDEVRIQEAQVEDQPSSPLDQSIAQEGSIYTETSMIVRHQLPSPSPQPSPRTGNKRRRSTTYQSSASDSDADSEDNHAHILTYANRPPPPRRRARNAFARYNNPKEEAARRIRMMRIEDFNREMKEREDRKQISPPEPKRIKTSNGLEEPSFQASENTSGIAAHTVPQSAPTTPVQHGGILAPLLNSASNIFKFWGSRSAAPRVQSQLLQTIKDTPVAPVTHDIPAKQVNDPGSNKAQLAGDDHFTPSKPLNTSVNDITAPEVFDSPSIFSPSIFKSSHRRSSRTNVRHNMQQRKRQASGSSPVKPSSSQESSQDIERIEQPPTKSRRLTSNGLPSSINSQPHYQDEAEEFEPENSPIHSNKRKLGKTFSMPEIDITSDSDPNTSDGIIAEPVALTLPSSSNKASSAEHQISPFNGHNIFTQQQTDTVLAVMPDDEHEPRVGRTYSMPESIAISNSDVSVSDVEFPYLKKPMQEWTGSDMKDWMKNAHDWDPEGFAAQVPEMLQGFMPSMFGKARVAIREMKAKAEADLEVEMATIRKARLAQLDADILQRRQELKEIEMKILRRSQEWQRHKEQLAYDAATEHQDYVQNGTPDRGTPSANAFNAVNPTDEIWTQAPPSSPTPSHAQLPGTPAAKGNVDWAENKTNHVTSPGPNEPPRYSGSPAATTKSALKGANGGSKPNNDQTAALAQLAQSDEARSGLTGKQLESYERKMNDVNKYTPKKPSRLREVSRLSSSPAVGGVKNPAVADANDDNLPIAADPSISDITMNTVSDLAQSPAPFEVETPSPIDISPVPFNASARALAWEAIQNMPLPFPVLSGPEWTVRDTSLEMPREEYESRRRNVVLALGLGA